MPIGVPRIIYCWGEELPAQWTDIYNFIFRRRMVFLMQYLDDELCNQICGLLINIHMEDRSKELEKKEIERSGLLNQSKKENTSAFQSKNQQNSWGTSAKLNGGTGLPSNSFPLQGGKKNSKVVEDLLISNEDLDIVQNDTLEQYTLQKITTEWLNWNAQFFDYSEEPYLFYLAELFSKDSTNNDANLLYNANPNQISSETSWGTKSKTFEKIKGLQQGGAGAPPPYTPQTQSYFGELREGLRPWKTMGSSNLSKSGSFELYSPFRLLANFVSNNYSLKKVDPLFQGFSGGGGPIPGVQRSFEPHRVNEKKKLLGGLVDSLAKKKLSYWGTSSLSMEKENYINGGLEKGAKVSQKNEQNCEINSFLSSLAQTNFSEKKQNSDKQKKLYQTVLSQREIRKNYLGNLGQNSKSKEATKNLWRNVSTGMPKQNSGASQRFTAFNYLNFDSGVYDGQSPSYDQTYNEFRDYYRKQTERVLQEEESKKVFVIINSFGGSVGNGITVHDALQFIKAGSLTLALGVAASAASLALAGGTIGERYVTEGCHIMIHQPEGGIQGQASDIWIDSQEIMKIRLDVAEIYSLSTYRPRHKILRDLDRDFYFTATETINYGLADEIATNEIMHEIIEMTSKVWDIHDSKQQRLLESRESISSGVDTQTQN